MIGSIIGDIIGSRFEFKNTDRTDFDLFTKDSRFTDDTICTVGIADALLSKRSYRDSLVEWCDRYYGPYFGRAFLAWIYNPVPYNSFGNGSAMRVSPVAWAFDTLEDVQRAARATAEVSHNHPEGIKGAVAIATAIFLLRKGADKGICKEIEAQFYDPNIEYKRGVFDTTCQGTVPVALRIMSESNGFENAIRKAVAWGGDSDTIAAMVGSMAEVYYGIPHVILQQAVIYLPDDIFKVIERFYTTYNYGKEE